MQNRRDWIKSSIALGGVLVSPSNFLTTREKELFRPRVLMKTLTDHLKKLEKLLINHSTMPVDTLILILMIWRKC